MTEVQPHACNLTDHPAQLTSCHARNRRNSSRFNGNSRISEESCTSSRAPADTHPQNASDCRSHAGRFGGPIPGCRREEHPPGHAPLPARQSGTVPEDNGGEPVPSEDVQASADEEGGHAERAAEVLGGGLKQLRQGRRPRCAVPVGLGRPEQMVPFLLGRALCVGQGVRHLSRHAYAVALVQVCVALRDRRNSLSLARRSVRQTLRRRSLHVQTSLSSVCRTCSQARSSAASPAGRRAVDQVAHRVASPPGPTARPRGCGGTYPSPRLGSCYVPAGRAEPATLLLTPLMMPLMMPCWVTARERRSNSPNPYRPVAPLSQ